MKMVEKFKITAWSSKNGRQSRVPWIGVWPVFDAHLIIKNEFNQLNFELTSLQVLKNLISKTPILVFNCCRDATEVNN